MKLFDLRLARASKIRSALILTVLSTILLSCASGSKTPEAKELDPKERTQHFLNIASGALKENNTQLALESLKEAEKFGKEDFRVYRMKAIALHRKNRVPEATVSAREAVRLDPKDSASRNTLGKLLLDQKQFAEAETHLRVAADDSLNREGFIARTNLGMLYYRTRRYKKAELEFEKAIREAPAFACVAYYFRGHLSLKRQRVDLAIKDYQSATKRYCGNYPDAHYALGVAYVRAKDYDNARKKFVEIQDLFPTDKVAEKALKRLRYLP